MTRRFILQLSAAPQLDSILGRIRQVGLTDDKIGRGLKEALTVGTDKAVTRLSATDGYFANLAVKILLPPRLRAVESGLRMVGMGSMADELIRGMNRAAERAAPAAKPIFIEALKRMTFADVRNILNGKSDTAATEFFRVNTSEGLTSAFRPPVSASLAEVGVTKIYKDFFGRLERYPFLRTERFDLDTYVVSKALDGLFYMVGEEEKKIRRDPAAQVSGLLREVFGSLRR
ncbi:MAG: DUF4197 domain-containing protein [Bryobacteraceae bacterium]|nr:DUF4197 domain-containing protein [Bryobacteraceae bacterium]